MDIEKYFAIQYKEGGRDETGCDCYGLARIVLEREFGKKVNALDWLNGGTFEAQEAAIAEGRALVKCEKVTDPMPGDIALMRVCGRPCHVGVFIEKGKVIQINRRDGVGVVYLSELVRKGKLEGVYRV
jgi:cell wall-associated NlpC family hydrolase